MNEEVDDVPLVAAPTERELTDRQLLDYTEYKRGLVEWLLHFGKEPAKAEGYARVTVRQVSYKTDQFYRWLWVEQDGYTTEFETNDLDDYLQSLVYSDEDYTSGFLSNVQKCLKRLCKWRATELGTGELWEPENTFSHSASQPQDFLILSAVTMWKYSPPRGGEILHGLTADSMTIDERKQIREAALEYGSIPSYNSLTSEERDRWKAYLAQRFEKPKSEVTRDDWERANGWKIPSLVWASLDTGLRPI